MGAWAGDAKTMARQKVVSPGQRQSALRVQLLLSPKTPAQEATKDSTASPQNKHGGPPSTVVSQ